MPFARGEHIGWRLVFYYDTIQLEPVEIEANDEKVAREMSRMYRPSSTRVEYFLTLSFPCFGVVYLEWDNFKRIEPERYVWCVPCGRCGERIFVWSEPDHNQNYFVCGKCYSSVIDPARIFSTKSE